MSRLRFTANPYWPVRRATREVRAGDVGIGGRNPIRIQSMTTTDTQDTKASADQIERLAAAGCEIVRLTAPSIRDAANLREIAAELARRRVRVPLVADIHFTPNAAMIAAENVEKVRINPGNFADKKKFEVREYDDAAWAEEVARVAERFRPLVRRCKELGRAMRIGTNHGSLSDRILNRYGDTPAGMVASALEFLDVCEDEGFFDVVFSMKASNTQVAIQAYRLLADRLAERAPGRPGYPFHVGVTEAGDGEDGRIKSAIGIGALLEDGIGDTIRVSLTPQPGEARTQEVVIAREILQSLGLRSFNPSVTACPGCGRTTSTTFQELAKQIDDFLRAQMPVWTERYPGVEKMKVAVMGCIVNGPGESKHADIGISLPGTGEAPAAPVFIDGEKALTLRGAGIATEFQALVERYIERRYGAADVAR